MPLGCNHKFGYISKRQAVGFFYFMA